jgi:hypothetical protein
MPKDTRRKWPSFCKPRREAWTGPFLPSPQKKPSLPTLTSQTSTLQEREKDQKLSSLLFSSLSLFPSIVYSTSTSLQAHCDLENMSLPQDTSLVSGLENCSNKHTRLQGPHVNGALKGQTVMSLYGDAG